MSSSQAVEAPRPSCRSLRSLAPWLQAGLRFPGTPSGDNWLLCGMGAAGSKAGGEVDPGVVEARVREVARTSGIAEEKVAAMTPICPGAGALPALAPAAPRRQDGQEELW